MGRIHGETLHSWEVTPKEARAIQDRLRGRVVAQDDFQTVCTVAGVDVGFEDGGAITRAAIAVLRFPTLEPLDQALARRVTRFPYVPGLLSFREIPAILEAFERVDLTPDLLLCDGQGYAHPRRFGLACHLGVVTGLPSIGVAKSRLIGGHDEVGNERGSSAPLMHEGEIVGVVLRTRDGVRPVYVSIGHRISLTTAVHYVLACTPRYRLPETTRHAHRLASQVK
jgi:deoxyribonuclease V